MDRNNNITIIHIVCALLVMLGHTFVLLGQGAPALLYGGWPIHEVGVNVLFMISGYLTAMSYARNRDKKHRAGRYLLKRLVRLYPPLIFFMLATVLFMRLVTVLPDTYWSSAGDYIVNNLQMRPRFFLDGVLTDTPVPGVISGSLWTLPVELACYILLIPLMELLFRLPKRVGPWMTLAISVALSFFYAFRASLVSQTTWIFWDTDWLEAIRLFSCFMIGVFFSTFELKKYLNWQIAVLLVLPLLCLGVRTRRFVEPFVFFYLVMCFALAEKPRFTRWIKHDVCYGLYLFSFPIQQLVIQYAVVRHQWYLPILAYLIPSVALTWGMALLNYYLIEKPVGRINL